MFHGETVGSEGKCFFQMLAPEDGESGLRTAVVLCLWIRMRRSDGVCFKTV
jgi:hypothetical protein